MGIISKTKVGKMTFWIFKKNKKNGVKYQLTTDIHSHILPSIDDGAKNLNESVVMLKAMQDLGYKKVIATPHIMADVYKNSPDKIRESLALLQKEAKLRGLKIKIEAAAEYYLDEGFLEHLESGDILTFGENYLLFETSFSQKPHFLEEMIFEMQANGYKPVFAHPERYRYIKNDGNYIKLKESGVLFQINLNSLSGYYGREAKHKAEFLVNRGLVDFVGSDAHSIRHLENIKKIQSMDIYNSIFMKNKIMNNFTQI